MKPNTRNGQSEAAMALYAHQFDRLVIIYFDADGLKRGFQFWLGWPGGTDKLHNCVPIYFAPGVTPPGLDERLRAVGCDTLVLLCLARNGTISSKHIVSLAGVLQRSNTARRGLVVLFATSRPCAAWRRRWPLPGSLDFSLGRYTVNPLPRSDDDEGILAPRRYQLRAVRPAVLPVGASAGMPGSRSMRRSRSVRSKTIVC